jgi:hypothetical protein
MTYRKKQEAQIEIKKPGFIIDMRYSREEVPGTAAQRYKK